MNRIHLLLILLCVALGVNLIYFITSEPTAPSQMEVAVSSEPILNFDTELRVTATDEVIVSEQIKVKGEAKLLKRGIVRPLPLVILDSKNKNMTITYNLISLMRNGQAIASLEPTTKGNTVLYYLGESDKFLAPGEYDYFFQYQALGMIEKLPEMKRIFHDVVGDSELPVHSSSLTIRLPETLSSENVVMKSKIVTPTSPNSNVKVEPVVIEGTFAIDQGLPLLSFQTPRQLAPHERFMVEVTWASH